MPRTRPIAGGPAARTTTAAGARQPGGLPRPGTSARSRTRATRAKTARSSASRSSAAQDYTRQAPRPGFTPQDYEGQDFHGQQGSGPQEPQGFGRGDRDDAARMDPALQDFFAPQRGGAGLRLTRARGPGGPASQGTRASVRLPTAGRPWPPQAPRTGTGPRPMPRGPRRDDPEPRRGLGMRGLIAIGAVVAIIIVVAVVLVTHKSGGGSPTASNTHGRHRDDAGREAVGEQVDRDRDLGRRAAATTAAALHPVHAGHGGRLPDGPEPALRRHRHGHGRADHHGGEPPAAAARRRATRCRRPTSSLPARSSRSSATRARSPRPRSRRSSPRLAATRTPTPRARTAASLAARTPRWRRTARSASGLPQHPRHHRVLHRDGPGDPERRPGQGRGRHAEPPRQRGEEEGLAR